MTKKTFEEKLIHLPSGIDLIGSLISEFKNNGRQSAIEMFDAIGRHMKMKDYEMVMIRSKFQDRCREAGLL